MKKSRFIIALFSAFSLFGCAELDKLQGELSSGLSQFSSFGNQTTNNQLKTLEEYKNLPLYKFKQIDAGYYNASLEILDNFPWHDKDYLAFGFAKIMIDNYGKRANSIQNFTSRSLERLSIILNDKRAINLAIQCDVYGSPRNPNGCYQISHVLDFAEYCQNLNKEEVFKKIELEYGKRNLERAKQEKAKLVSACNAFSTSNSPVYNSRLVIELYEKFLSLDNVPVM